MFDANNVEGTLTNHQHMERFSNDTCFSCCHVGIRVIRRFITWSSEQELKRLLKLCKARHVLTHKWGLSSAFRATYHYCISECVQVAIHNIRQHAKPSTATDHSRPTLTQDDGAAVGSVGSA